jgi:hypothetical protein
MMSQNTDACVGVFVLLFLCETAFPQSSDRAYRRAAVLDGNNIKTVFGNWGVLGQPATGGPRGAWKYPSNGYIGDLSFMVGVELPTNPIAHSVITCPVDRPTQLADQSPGGVSWTFEPVTGFFNPSQSSIALSNAPSSWPSAWGGYWNGLNGMGAELPTIQFRIEHCRPSVVSAQDE